MPVVLEESSAAFPPVHQMATTNRKSAIGNRKCFWRRGWDSNPRNGFPLTAFPVLPIQPLLHLSREIADCRFKTLYRPDSNRQIGNKNRQCYGGAGGIRTHSGRLTTPVLQTVALIHSATSPTPAWGP